MAKEKRVVVTFADCEAVAHGEAKAVALYRQICRIGGFGDVGKDFLNGYPVLDVSGLDEAKTAEVEKLLTAKEK